MKILEQIANYFWYTIVKLDDLEKIKEIIKLYKGIMKK